MKIGAGEKSREGFDQGEGRHLHIRLLHLHIGHLRAGHHLHIELASPSVYHKGHRLNSLTPLSESCQKIGTVQIPKYRTTRRRSEKYQEAMLTLSGHTGGYGSAGLVLK